MSTSRVLPGAAARRTLVALGCAPFLLLAACGGGGDAASPGGGSTSGPLTITSDNARAVAADALDSATHHDLEDGGNILFSGVGATGSFRPLGTPSGLPVSVLITETTPCRGGGSVTLVRDPETFRPPATGDLLEYTASNCTVLAGGFITMSGGVAITIAAPPAGSPEPPDRILLMEGRNFTLASDGRTTISNGDLSWSLRAPERVERRGASLSVRVMPSTGDARTFTLKDYRQASTFDAGLSSLTVDATVETDNRRLGGSARYSVRTPVPLVTAADAFTSGSLRVDAGASSLRLTVIATNTFRLDVDNDGDGTVDSTSTATREELRAELQGVVLAF